MRRLAWTGIGLLVAVLGAPPAAAQVVPPKAVRKPTLAEDLQMFSQVFHQIRLNHPDSVDTHKLIMSAIEGMLEASDPHSYALPATRLSPEMQDALRAGKLVPVPIAVEYRNGAPFVVAVSPGSKAAGLDILRGDELTAADGIPITAQSAEELELVLAGPKGSAVSLMLRRVRSDGSTIDVERRVTREWGGAESPVPSAFLLNPTTGYLRITTFSSDRVDEDLRRELTRLEKSGMQRLVLDLRDNGGGSVDEAMRTASAFLSKGEIVYIMELRGRKPDTVRVTKGVPAARQTMSIAVLINSGTASASELVPGALQEHDRANVLGRPSFGKSLVMLTLPLTDGSLVVLVTGRLRTPCGRIVQREYHNMSLREYYRRAEAVRDTSGTPACVTKKGRKLFAGGGIIPNRWLPEPAPTPLWFSRLYEADLPEQWAAGFLSTQGTTIPPLETLYRAPALPAAALADFRTFATSKGAVIPGGPEADTLLGPALLRRLVLTRDGVGALLTLRAWLDPEVQQAVTALDGSRK